MSRFDAPRSTGARLGWPAAVLAAAGCLLLGGCRASAPGDGHAGVVAAGLPPGTDTVVRDVVDGDTIVVGDGTRVRLIGVDTPETKDPHRPVQCFGKQASERTARLLPPGTRVRLVRDVEPTDRYGRSLAYVLRLRDGLFVNAALVRDGFGRPLVIAPNVAYAAQFQALAREASDQGRGLWGACRTAAIGA